MSKLILCLLLLFNIYICEETKNVRVFTKDDAKNEISVRLGEEFALKFVANPSAGYSWNFLNKNETKESLQLLRTRNENPLGRLHIVGNPRNVYYYFKAVKETNEAVSLKFSYGRQWEKSNILPITTFKINVK